MAEFLHDCLECGKTYTAQRSTSKFCTSKCRLRNSRKNKSLVHVPVELSVASDALKRLLDAPRQEVYRYMEQVEQLRVQMLELDASINEYIAENFD